jgi:hypothetical protein
VLPGLVGGSGVIWASTSSPNPAGHSAPAAAQPLDTVVPSGASNYVPMTRAATAVQVVITATGPAGASDLAEWSLGGAFPGTRVLSYGRSGDVSRRRATGTS